MNGQIHKNWGSTGTIQNTHTRMHACTHARTHTHTKTALFKFQLEPFQNFEVGAFFCCSTLLFHTHTHTHNQTLLAVDTDVTRQEWNSGGGKGDTPSTEGWRGQP